MADFNQQDSFPEPNGDAPESNPFESPSATAETESEYVTRASGALNPWISMWMQPRHTVRQMLETAPKRWVVLLAILAGIGLLLDQMIYLCLGSDFTSRVIILVFLLVFCTILGVLLLYLYGFLLAAAGRSLGGVGRAIECRTAYAWSAIPTVWMVPVYLVAALVVVAYGSEVLLSDVLTKLQDGVDFEVQLLPTWLKIVSALAVVTRIWQIILSSQSIGEAHQFSSGKGFLTFVFANLMLIGIALTIFLPLSLMLSI